MDLFTWNENLPENRYTHSSLAAKQGSETLSELADDDDHVG